MIDKEKLIEFAKSKYDERYFQYHILPVVSNAKILAMKMEADIGVVEVAAYLHDIGTEQERKNYRPENDHHITGAKMAREFLESLSCEEELISKVEHCILAHRGRKEPEPSTLEAKIISSADAMAHFDTFIDLFLGFMEGGNTMEETIVKIDQKIDRDWNNKIKLTLAREMAKGKYDAVKLILAGMMGYVDEKK